jgi:DNA-binding MarR family transcriptional regulator
MSGESSQQPGPADPVVDALLRASRALVSITARSLSSVNAGVTLPQFRTLVMLATRGPQTVSALADHLAVHASTMTRMCNRLVTRDLVVRAPSAVDRREVLITLSPSGATLVDEVMQTRRNELDAIVEGMSPDEREAFVTTLRRFATAAGDDGTRAVDPDDVATRVHSIGPSTYDFGA